MAFENINFEKMDGVGIITLNRPESRNALTLDMVAEMGEAIEACKRPDVRAVLLTGAGGGFCSGADLKFVVETLEKSGQDGVQAYIRALANDLHTKVVLGLRRLEKPVVAGINGVAAGAGFSLTLACDMRVAAKSARFLMAYANIGAPADGGSTYLLPRLVGAGRAMELYLASQPTSAQAALEMGLVNQVVEDDALHRHAMETAVRLAQGPTLAYARVKALFDSSWENDLSTQLDAETEAFADICLTADFQEGIKAFTERRQARFQGK
ncbi:MAG: enoyl-CoA hydratase/isomerase family protein [Chloroflexi bacterium]|nr:enoyl-CoA hydratase/isomerase family protein [Chloroflexota bacterium]MCI0863833.1 enoyl-CoA hydratase/isomerase family protein [Chloroflexota bacterium]MCI0903626.1 enoyl-CoA hydratase/isomerase family protein [Chloroflexota bacterium]